MQTESEANTRDHALVHVYRRLPLNVTSRLWGKCHRVPLPKWVRSPAYRVYSSLCSCNLAEAQFESLSDYRSLGEFFRRDLRPGARPICVDSGLVSPVDGVVVHCGVVTGGQIEQVKGVTYSLRDFLGHDPVPRQLRDDTNECPLRRCRTEPELGDVSDAEFHRRLLQQRNGTQLLHCVIYLSPGDYHKFHSPADWQLMRRRHFAGELLSVSPAIAQRVRGLFCLNERVVCLGKWSGGFFCLAAVGATNVGSIRFYCDQELRTNKRNSNNRGNRSSSNRSNSNSDINNRSNDSGSRSRNSSGSNSSRRRAPQDRNFDSPVQVAKGSLFGEFNFGSTIVLLFEAPEGMQLGVLPGQRVRVGQSLFCEAELL